MIFYSLRKIILLLLAIAAAPVFAADNSSTGQNASDLLAVDSLLRVSGGLLLVLLMMVLVFWLMKRAQVFKGGLHSELKVLGAISVGQREKLVLAQVGDAQILLGVAPGRVNKIHVLDKPLVVEKIAAADEQSFASRLEGLLSKKSSADGDKR